MHAGANTLETSRICVAFRLASCLILVCGSQLVLYVQKGWCMSDVDACLVSLSWFHEGGVVMVAHNMIT